MRRQLRHIFSLVALSGSLALPLSATAAENREPHHAPDPAPSPVLASVGQTVACQPAFRTKPQPRLEGGLKEEVLFDGCLNQPTALSFQSDKSRLYVAEKGGRVWDCDISSASCKLFADLSSEVCNDADRGLLGLAVDPRNDGKVYVLYTTPTSSGKCTGAVVTGGQLSLLTGSGETKIFPAEGAGTQPWCFYYTSHSIGGLVFASDNKTLYVSAGEGASFNAVDYGQLDGACGDGTNLPQGAFRSQGRSSYSDGVILQLTNLEATTPGVTVLAKGFRNPFRFARAPGTNELYVGNVGWDTWEAIDHVTVGGQNFGWPCYEGWDPGAGFAAAPQPGYQKTGFCGSVVGVTAPFFAYAHDAYVTPQDVQGKTCGAKPASGGPDQNGSVISAIGFTDGTNAGYPRHLRSALFFGDMRRQCIWTMQPPDNTPQAFAKGLQGGPVDIQAGEDGDLFYADILTSTVRRIAGHGRHKGS
jgi:glucose/arabinose dehydrogenase